MIREERIIAALAAVPESCRETVEPVLRTLVHDLSGALSAVMIEAFSIEQLSASLREAAHRERSPDVPQAQLESLREAALNLREAADDAASYLTRVEALTSDLSDEAGGGGSSSPPGG